MSSPTLQLQIVSQAQVDEEIANHLVGSQCADRVTLDCALARTVVWTLTRCGRSVHIQGLMNVLLDVGCALSGATDERPLRARFHSILDDLLACGDLLELPGGRWHPAPVREIDLGRLSQSRLLVGGLPTSALPVGLRQDIVHERAFRHVRGTRLGEALGVPTEPWESWAGVPSAALAEWTKPIVNSDLAVYAEDDGNIRIYAPGDASKRAPQRRRWRENLAAASGRFLADRVRRFGRREFRIVEIESGRVERAGAVILSGEARRLMYALDALAGNSVEVLCATSDEAVELTLWNELPSPERRLFGALGTLTTLEGRYYPRRWRFAPVHREIVTHSLQKLGVKLVEGRASRRATR